MKKVILITIILFLFCGCDKTTSSNSSKNSEINSNKENILETIEKERQEREKERQEGIWYSENPFYVELKTNYFVKNVRINGFSVEFFYNLGCSESYEIKDLKKDDTKEIIIEYTKYSKNGFGHHLNEENKKIKVQVERSLETRQRNIENSQIVVHYQDIILD